MSEADKVSLAHNYIEKTHAVQPLSWSERLEFFERMLVSLLGD